MPDDVSALKRGWRRVAGAPASRLAGLLGDLRRRRPNVGRHDRSWTEIAMPSVGHWLEPLGVTLDVTLEMPDGRSLPVGEVCGREVEAIGAPEVARAAMAGRDARLDGLRLALSTDLRIAVNGGAPLLVPTFNAAADGLRVLLAGLAGGAARDACLYDDLDQGWALRIDLRASVVEVVEWDWDASAGTAPRIAWRLPHDIVRAEAARAAVRFERAHAACVAAAGEDLWSPRP